MKKLLVAMLAVAMLTMACFAADITVTLDGEPIDFADQAPEIVEGRTLVPLRAIFEALGASVEWDQVTRTVTSEMGGTTIQLTVGSDTLYKNDEPVTLDVPAQIINSRTMVPARAIAESYGVGVEWDAATRTVVLTKPVVEAPKVELPEGTILYLTGENYTGKEGAYPENSSAIQVVENPDKAGDMVLYLETNVQEKQAWNYLWYPCEYVPGQTYLITYSARPGNDAFGNPIIQASFGTNVRTNATDKGVGSNMADGDAWKNIAIIYTIPEDIDVSKDMKFGIFASPVEVSGYDHNLAWSFYVDNISVIPYDGDEEDGIKDPALFMPPTGSGVPVGFDIDKAAGYSIDISGLQAVAGAYQEGVGFEFDTPAEDADCLLMMSDLALDASKYAGVAVEFKRIYSAKAAHSQMFFTTVSDDNVSEDKSAKQQYIEAAPAANGFMVSYFDFTEISKWNGTINMIRFDPGDGAGNWIISKIKVIEK